MTDPTRAGASEREDATISYWGAALDALSLHEHEGTYYGHVSPECRSTSVAVTEMVSAITETAQTGLTPLYDAIDPDALDALCAPRDHHRSRPDVRFEYEGFEVTIHDGDSIELRRSHGRHV